MTAPLALVTGGVKRVGAVIAARLAESGYALALHGNSDTAPEDRLAATMRESGSDWCGFQQDFTLDGAARDLMYQRRPTGSERACVVHILDQRIRNPNRDQLSYTLSKQALTASVRSMAVACADRLRVNGVAPGLTLTAGEYDAGQLANIKAMMPLDRLPDPADIADAVLYLARAEAVTGQIVEVDGGANLRAFDRDFVHLGKD